MLTIALLLAGRPWVDTVIDVFERCPSMEAMMINEGSPTQDALVRQANAELSRLRECPTQALMDAYVFISRDWRRYQTARVKAGDLRVPPPRVDFDGPEGIADLITRYTCAVPSRGPVEFALHFPYYEEAYFGDGTMNIAHPLEFTADGFRLIGRKHGRMGPPADYMVWDLELALKRFGRRCWTK